MIKIKITLINLSNIDSTYQNSIDFSSEYSRDIYLYSRTRKEYEINYRNDSFLSEVTINDSFINVSRYNYALVKKEDKLYCYFIVNLEQVTETKTKIFVELDVLSTYQFDFDILDSYVERCHIPRWDSEGKPIENTEEEGFNINDFIVEEIENIYQLNHNFLLCSTNPLGKIEEYQSKDSGLGSNAITTTGGSVIDGIPSANGFLFIKQEEGFAQYPGYFTGESFKTGGYGITENNQPSYYNMLGNAPIPEKLASEVLLKCLVAEFGTKVRNLMLDDNIDLSRVRINQFDVFVSLAFNYGLTGLQNLNCWKLFLANPFNIDGVADAIASLQTNHDRRVRESEVYRISNYLERPINKYDENGNINGNVEENEGLGYFPSPPYNGGTINDTSGYKITNVDGVNYILGAKGKISSDYGYRTHPITGAQQFHTGIDIANTKGTKILASGNGTVFFAGWQDPSNHSKGYGQYIKIAHEGNVETRYAHLNSLLVKEGDRVQQGQVIGYMGTTGSSTGSHLHFEIRKNGNHIDPAPGVNKNEYV